MTHEEIITNSMDNELNKQTSPHNSSRKSCCGSSLRRKQHHIGTFCKVSPSSIDPEMILIPIFPAIRAEGHSRREGSIMVISTSFRGARWNIQIVNNRISDPIQD